MHSIRFKITAITVAAILTTIASILTAWGYTFQSENDRRSVEIMSLISRDTQNALEDYFQSVQLSVELTSNTAIDSLDRVTLVENGVAGAYATQAPRTQAQIDRLDEYLANHCLRVQETFRSVASRTRGVVTYYYAINPEVSEKVHGFYYSKVGKAGFHRQTPPDPATFDPENETHAAWYFTPIERGQPCWVGPYNDSTLDELWVISYVVPVYRAGRLIGLLGMDIPVETLVEQVRPIHVYETGFASLYDTEGRVIYHPTLPVGSTPEEAGLTSHKGILLSESSGSELIRYTMDGEERQIAFTTLSNGMRLVVSAPVREINAWWLRLTRYIIITSVVVILLYVLVLTFVVRLITQPLRLLTEASQKLADADYDVALTVRGKDEVGMLTRAFIQMRAQLKQYIEDLNHRIYYDSMTDLPNMRYFFNLVEKERDRMVEAGQKPVMLYFNLVGIKHYNRQYGFDEGDRLICEIAGILRRHFGDKLLCRISSDHFAAVSDATGLEAVLNELFMECLAANGGQSLPVRVGIYPNELEDVNVNVACDRAKYACDYNRGNSSGYHVFDEKMLRQAENTRYIISHLDQALEEQWIKVYYQPIIRAVDGKICDEEALARWIDPEKGMLPPIDFIPILEDARLIYKLDLYMLDRILEKMKLTANMGITVVPHSVNLSRSDFDACDIVE
ncbi:MAG: EAL domain-containing protein, partial [bacterium]